MNTLLPKRALIYFKSRAKVVEKLDYAKREIYLAVDSDIEYATRLHSCEKEREMIRWIETFFGEGEVFFDVGANVGAYSLVAAKFFGGAVKVYAFEPAFLNFAQLARNVALNGCEDCVYPLPVALSDETKVDTLYHNNLVPGGALHVVGGAVDFKGEHFHAALRSPVLAFRMDDLIREFALPVPNHLKIDVDGTEIKVLKGAERVLANPALKSVFVEIEEERESSVQAIGLLEKHGFRLLSKHKYTPPDDRGPFSKIYNYIFCSPSLSRPQCVQEEANFPL